MYDGEESYLLPTVVFPRDRVAPPHCTYCEVSESCLQDVLSVGF